MSIELDGKTKVLTIEDIRAQVARIDHRVDGHQFRWNVTEAFERRHLISKNDVAHIGYFIQIEYDEADIDHPEGPEQIQQGRKWFVGKNVSPSEVIQTCLKAALASAEHRTREWFLVDGERAYGPHMNVNDLIAVQKGGS